MTPERISEMLMAVDGLDNGAKAQLRRNAHKHFENADYKAMGIFLRIIPPDTPRYEQAPLFAAVCNRCLWKDPRKGMAFPDALALLKSKKNGSDTIEKRFMSLLDEPMEADGLFSIKLYRLCHMLSAEGINIDWAVLCSDLTKWGNQERYIQRRWMRSYFSVHDDDTADNKSAKEE